MSRERTTISLQGVDLLTLLGQGDANLRRLEDRFPGTLVVRGDQLILEGEPRDVDRMRGVVDDLVEWVGSGRSLDGSALDRILGGEHVPQEARDREAVPFAHGSGTTVEPRTHGQVRYLEALRTHDVVFAIGPAGSGKTYLAVVVAAQALLRGDVDRIFLVRPAVEAGEQLGFLPGDLQEKVDPYLRPLYDALTDCLGQSKLARMLANGTIEVAPLAYMRGRTLHRAFVILDEGQNTTLTQMKMFLTRIGQGTRAVVTGDITQIDLQNPSASGLVRVEPILAGVDGISFVRLDESDVVRHPLVRRIVAAFDGDSGPVAGAEEG